MRRIRKVLLNCWAWHMTNLIFQNYQNLFELAFIGFERLTVQLTDVGGCSRHMLQILYLRSKKRKSSLSE